MPYYFECDFCNHQVRFEMYSGPDFERQCYDCGQAMCESCVLIHGDDEVCPACQEAHEEAEDEDED